MTTLRLRQSSLEYDDTTRQQRDDLLHTVSRGDDIIGFTEATSKKLRLLIRAVGHANGYEWVPGKGDGGFLVKRGKGLRVLDSGSEYVIPRKPGEVGKGGHGARYLNWVKVDFYGEIVFVFEAHWLTGYRKNDYRLRMHVAMTEAVVLAVKHHGQGRALAFWMGDINVDDKKDNPEYDSPLDDGHLISVWDALEKWPDTHDTRTIDIIGYYLRDGRVTLVGAREDKAPRHKDHPDVSATFEIAA